MTSNNVETGITQEGLDLINQHFLSQLPEELHGSLELLTVENTVLKPMLRVNVWNILLQIKGQQTKLGVLN